MFGLHPNLAAKPMQILEFLSILRRRWFYVALGLVVGLVAGFVTAPGVSAEAESFQGTHALLVDSNSPSGQALNLEQTVLVVQSGAVPRRVAARLAEAGLAPYTKVNATADPDLRSLDITAYAPTADAAAAAANFFAEELNAELVGAQQSVADQAIAAATTQVTTLQAGLAQLDAQIAALAPEDPNRDTLLAQRQAIAQSYQEAQAELQAAQATGSPAPPLRTLEAASGRPEVVEGWRIPESKPTRAAMLGLFGLLLGMVGAIAAERLDTRVRNKEDAERAFDLPVIAEIPPLPAGTQGSRAPRDHPAGVPVRGGVPRAADGRAVRGGKQRGHRRPGSRPHRQRERQGARQRGRHRAAAGDRRPGAARHVALGGRGQDHHRGAPGRRAGRVRHAGARDQRRLPPSTHPRVLRRGPRAGSVRRARLRHRPDPPVRPPDGHQLRGRAPPALGQPGGQPGPAPRARPAP